jgi:hypothetical protein
MDKRASMGAHVETTTSNTTIPSIVPGIHPPRLRRLLHGLRAVERMGAQ